MKIGRHRNDGVGHGEGPPILQSCRNEFDLPPVLSYRNAWDRERLANQTLGTPGVGSS